MTMTAFDTHQVAEKLSGAGFTKTQVNAQVQILAEVTSELVTKGDLKAELSDLRSGLAVLKRDLIITMGIMHFTVACAILGAIRLIVV